MRNYLDLLDEVLHYGERKSNRTGIDTLCKFHATLEFTLQEGFPIVTTKKIHWKSIVHELLWFISGDTNIKYLQDNGVRIWNEWADENGDLGPVYGSRWRFFNGVDQLQNVINTLRTNPDDRRLIVSSWDPRLLPDNSKSFAENVKNGKQALPPCHYSFQFVHINGKLNLIWNQRSVDLFLGLPFNISSYALLLEMVAHITGLTPHKLVFSGADCHIYENHITQVKEQLTRTPYSRPSLILSSDVKEIDEFTYDDIELDGYQCHSSLTGKVAI